jgi:hypothetical protein
MEALVRRAFRETLRQRIHGWNTAIVSLEQEFCGGVGQPRTELAFQIEKLVAKRRIASFALLELERPPPDGGFSFQVPSRSD